MGVQDDYNEAWEAGEKAGRIDETERCAQLCMMRAAISRRTAVGLRRDGTFTVRMIWPPFKKRDVVALKWETAAQDADCVADAFEVVAACIRKGYDPRTPKIDPDEKIKL